MEKPGPGPQAAELIIERPEYQPPLHRAAFGLVTLVFWALWVYFMMPVVTLLGWAFGISRFVDIMVVHEGGRAVLRLLAWYLLVIALLSSVLVGWALYNWGRFRKRTRRGNTLKPLANEQIIARLRVERATLERWQSARVLQVNFDKKGRFTGVEFGALPVIQEPTEPPEPAPAAEPV